MSIGKNVGERLHTEEDRNAGVTYLDYFVHAGSYWANVEMLTYYDF